MRPLPPHVRQGRSTLRPLPPHPGHGWEIEKNPWFTATDPAPPHWGQSATEVPGSAPEPPHAPHAAAPATLTGTVTPSMA